MASPPETRWQPLAATNRSTAPSTTTPRTSSRLGDVERMRRKGYDHGGPRHDPPVVGSRPMPLDPARTVRELEELRALTGNENGAQRVAWTETWERGRAWLREKVSVTGAHYERDAAGNQWFTLPGRSDD